MPGRIAIEDVEPPGWCVFNWEERDALLVGRVRYGRGDSEEKNGIRVLLAEIVVHGPVDILARLHDQAAKLVFEAVESLGLLGSVSDPIVDSKAVRELIISAHAHVVERQKIKPVGPGIIHLILRVVALYSQRTGPFPEIYFEPPTEGNDEGAVGLKEVSVNLGARFVGRVALKSLRSLPPLEIQAGAPTLSAVGIGRILQDQRCLVDTEAVATHIVGTEAVHAA